MDEVCIKCQKPRDLKTDELVARCPHCKDFFKPLAELIVLHEEELNRLVLSRPGRVFFEYPILKRILALVLVIAVFAPFFSTRVLSIGGLVALLAYNRYMLRHESSLKIANLEQSLEQLNREYSKRYAAEENH